MTWQKCPHCNGSGIEPQNFALKPCTVCNGKKIINTLTGKPPQDDKEQIHTQKY